MFNPVSTYRLQFHSAFTFADLENIINYLHKLGVSTIYASPVFESVPGSVHGYDGVNPHRINPEIGSLDQLQAISKRLKADGISWLQDIVPNHMAFHPNNAWLMDVLEKGSLSDYKSFFDFTGDIMVPFLGGSLDETIQNGELKITYENGVFAFRYYDACWPLHLRSYPLVLGKSATTNYAIEQLLAQLPQIVDSEGPKAYSLASDEFKTQLASLFKQAERKKYIESCLKETNDDKEQLVKIAGQQAYTLCHWQETDKKINYRRFFTVNGLISLNIQDEEVFDSFHTLILKLQNQGVFDGLRIDHIDGLYDPTSYLEKLRQATGPETYIVVEKILEPGESLPAQWPIQGNTGYDFLSILNNLFTHAGNKRKFRSFYDKLTGNPVPVHDQILEKKAYILYQHMAGELENLYRLFLESELCSKDELASVAPDDLKHAIAQFLIHCPVYRYYGNRFPLVPYEENAIRQIFANIKKQGKVAPVAVSLLQGALLEKPQQSDTAYRNRAAAFYQRCMQFTGPLMAKGVEDTLMYTYNAFSAHNEVGDAPYAFGLSVEEFHIKMQERQKQWPLSINGSSTHDTKRGEDVRARLNVLSDMADEWLEAVQRWQQQHAELKNGGHPDANDEYFIYQTLIGAYPMPGEDAVDFSDRICLYLEKALREAKNHSNWTKPSEEYEQAAKDFTLSRLNKESSFWVDFEKLHKKVCDYGILNSLAQVLLKFTSPGVPDVYQGCELWDLSLVDPDNRRPVGYEKRNAWLDELEASKDKPDLLKQLWAERYSGKIKLWLTQTLLILRKEERDLFCEGHYIPLTTEGRYRKHVMAFARRHRQTWYVSIVPLHMPQLCKMQKTDITGFNWKDTRALLPPEAPENWQNLLSGNSGKQQKGILLSEAMGQLPLGLLKLEQPDTDRGAGILMHISSLPSPFGVGDFGPEAYAFAGFLSRSNQKYWQLLPLSPTEMGNGHSPYSAYSSMAGNPLLISPELLQQEGFLTGNDLKLLRQPAKDKADYQAAEAARNLFFETAWTNFKQYGDEPSKARFDGFCRKEAYWLDDFALYVALKLQHEGKPWHTWEDGFKLRNRKALAAFSAENADAIDKARWLQFVFFKQWRSLKRYCNGFGIELFGDVPFYVSYDSADVWANPDIFSLDDDGKMLGMAGVPPDYFNSNGQLWGMPVFRWDVLKEQGYEWWIQRIKKNMELYDLVRLDHFRAFSAYWEVPAAEETAINGEWKAGPGADFFEVLKSELGNLPFVAEDLGDIDEPVYQLRDKFMLPGMKVLQFAFGGTMPQSDYIPHNYSSNFIAYTGTHDNNTTLGWYRQDADRTVQKQIEQYTGLRVREKNIHKVLGQMAYASVAKIAMLPIQDVIGLDESARMNTPASTDSNWLWRLIPKQLDKYIEKRLRDWAKMYNRV